MPSISAFPCEWSPNKSPCPRWKSPEIMNRPSKRKETPGWLVWGWTSTCFFVVWGDSEIILSSRNSHSTTLDTLSASEFDYENHSCLNYAMQFNQTKLVSWQNIFRWQDTGWTQGIPTTKGMGLSMPIGLFGLDWYCRTFFKKTLDTTLPAPRCANSLVVVCWNSGAHQKFIGRRQKFLMKWHDFFFHHVCDITLPINLPQTIIPPLQTSEILQKVRASETMMEPCWALAPATRFGLRIRFFDPQVLPIQGGGKKMYLL